MLCVPSKGMSSPDIVWLDNSNDQTPVNSQSNNKKKRARSPKMTITKEDGTSSKIQIISECSRVEKVKKTSLVEKNRKTIYTLERGHYELCDCGQATCYGCHWSHNNTEISTNSSIHKIALRLVKWNEYKEINKATLTVNQLRAAKGEYFAHPLLFNTDTISHRNKIAQKKIIRLTEDILKQRALSEVVSEFTGEVLIDRDFDAISMENLKHIKDYAYEVAAPNFAYSNTEFGGHMRRCSAVFPDIKALIEKYSPMQAYIFPFYKGNTSRFASHGCLPNVTVIRAMCNDIRPEAYKLYFLAITDIPAGNELFLDYGKNYKGMSECLCGTALCSNINILKYLARLTKDCSPQDVLNIVEQRLSNQSSLSIIQSLLFEKWELSRASGQPDPETVSSSMETRMIDIQVAGIVSRLQKNIPISVNHVSLKLLDQPEDIMSKLVKKRNLSTLLSTSNMALLNENIEKYEHFMNRESSSTYKPRLLKELICRLIHGYSRQNSSPDKVIEVINIDNDPASTSIRLNIQRKSASSGHHKRVFGSILQNSPTKDHTGIAPLATTPGSFQDKLKGFRIPKKRRIPPDTPVVKSKQ